MAGNEGLFKALQIFQQGVGQLATSVAINRANEAVQQIKEQETDKAKQMQAIRGVASDLAMRLSSMGAPTSQIETAFNAISPKAPTVQTFEQGEAQALAAGDTEMAKAYGEASQRKLDHQMNLLDRKIEGQIKAGQAASEAKLNKERKTALNDFGKVAKAELEGMDALESAPGELANGNLGYVMNLKSLLKRTDPRISDKDYETAAPNVSMLSRVNRVYDALVNNKPLPDDLEATQEMIRALSKRTQDRLVKKATGFAKSRADLIGWEPDQLLARIQEERLLAKESASGVPTPQTASPSAPATKRGIKLYKGN